MVGVGEIELLVFLEIDLILIIKKNSKKENKIKRNIFNRN